MNCKRFAYVHLAPSLDQMARTYAQAQAGHAAGRAGDRRRPADRGRPVARARGQACAVAAGAHGARHDPGRCRGQDRGDRLGRCSGAVCRPGAGDRWSAMRRARARKILGQRIVTPLDLEADNPNLVGGDQVCGSHHLSQHFLFRPARGHADGSTPITGPAPDRGRRLARRREPAPDRAFFWPENWQATEDKTNNRDNDHETQPSQSSEDFPPPAWHSG